MNPGPVLPTEDLDVPEPSDLQAIGPALRVLTLNVEGLSAAKRTVLSSLAKRHSADVICLQETHVASSDPCCRTLYNWRVRPHHSNTRCQIWPGNIRTFGRYTAASPISSFTFCDIIQVGGYRIANVYKAPSAHWNFSMLSTLQHPVVYVGDYNIHHPE